MNCGIYKITNTVNSKVYVGSSKDIRRRFAEYCYKLKNNKSNNIYLQRVWNKYGKNSFVFIVLLYCDEENLVFYEQRAIDEYKTLDKKNGYNIRPAERRDLLGNNYDEWINNLSKNHANFSGKNHPNAKAVEIEGKYYSTIKEAAQDLKINYGTLKSRIKKGIDLNKSIQKGCKGKRNINSKAVIVCNKRYETLTEAAKNLNIDYRTLKKKIKTNKPGYFWG